MCDEFTLEADGAALAKRGLSRRDFAAISAATVGTMMSTAAMAQQGGAPDTTSAGPKPITEGAVTVTTPDGKMDAIFYHPVDGKHPAVIMWPDIAGVRDAKKVMARELAGAGYAVLLVNQYYRSQPAPVMNSISEFFVPENREKLTPMIQKITVPGIESDAKALVAWLDANPAVDAAKKIGVEGYCMTGSYGVRCATAVPDRIGAACSFHGGGLVTPAPDSPHKKMAGTKAAYLFAIAKNDDVQRPNDRTDLRHAAEEAGVAATIEWFNADHGWCVPDAPAYQQVEAKRARTLALWHYARMG